LAATHWRRWRFNIDGGGKDSTVRFIVLMAAMGLSGEELLHAQRRALAESQGINSSDIDRMEKEFADNLAIVRWEKTAK
jgi:hypothetical protein